MSLTPPLMLFAAGLGTRMGQLTAKQPKPLIKVAGRALIDHALALADAAKVGPVVVNTHYRSAQIRTHLAHRPDLIVSDEQPLLLETGGGLRHALPLLGNDPVLTLNSDAVWTGPNPLMTLRKGWDGTRMDALLLMVPKARAMGHTGRGDFLIGEDGALTRGPGDIYTGAQMLRTDLLAEVPDAAFSLNRIWDMIAARGRLYGMLHLGGWCDVGQPQSIQIAEDMLAAADV